MEMLLIFWTQYYWGVCHLGRVIKPRFSQRHLANIIISNLCYRPYMNRLRYIINIVH